MKGSIRFWLNDRIIEAVEAPGRILLDYLRINQGLVGTKEGCREGDCGACMILLGERVGSSFRYSSVASCLLALGELDGCHILTIEGLSAYGLSPVQEAILEKGASQCGFCTPGIVVALTAYLMGAGKTDEKAAETAVEGNLCRCTGYGSIRRVCSSLADRFSSLPLNFAERILALESARIIPPSVRAFLKEGETMKKAELEHTPPKGSELPLGGGTDYFVRNPESPSGNEEFAFLDKKDFLRGVVMKGGRMEIGAAESIESFFDSDLIASVVPNIRDFKALVASGPIRQRATLGGNIANASPAADMSAILIALDASVRLSGRAGERELPLEDFFLGYKKTVLREGEYLSAILLPVHPSRILFNFEKVSKRMHLDIASVNTAMSIALDNGKIIHAKISAGGLAPVPLSLRKTTENILGKKIDAKTAREAATLARSEIAPIDDVRGSADYRRRLLSRLILAHFLAFTDDSKLSEELEP